MKKTEPTAEALANDKKENPVSVVLTGFLSGERGKPDLILPKYVRNDITLSM